MESKNPGEESKRLEAIEETMEDVKEEEKEQDRKQSKVRADMALDVEETVSIDEDTPKTDKKMNPDEKIDTAKPDDDTPQPVRSTPVPKTLSHAEQFEEDLKEFSSDVQTHIRYARGKADELLEFRDNPEWEESESKNGITISFLVDGPGLKMVRGEGDMDFSCEEVIQFLRIPGIAPKYNDAVEESKVVERIGMNTVFTYQKMKGKFVVASRDFSVLSQVSITEKGEHILCASSREHPEIEDVKGCVRGTVIISGWILTPNEDDSSKCHAVYMGKSDPKGNIPQGMVNTVVKKTGYQIQKVNELIPDYYDEVQDLVKAAQESGK